MELVNRHGIVRDQVQARPKPVSRVTAGTKAVFVVTAILTLILAIFYMRVQGQIYITQTAIQNIEVETLNLQAQTEEILHQNSNQFNYDLIKQAAGEQGLTIDPARVRSVE
ncbi:TPA: hypothetical protein ACGO1T_000048 [Streptococcus suis]